MTDSDAAITIERLEGDVFAVCVAGAGRETRHHVLLAPVVLARLAPGHAPERLVEAAFRFLLDREPAQAILARFDLPVIARYFPEFERELPRYLARG
ncbi:MAG: hypothetical protein CVT80_08535 [Alphaproteobacteria bacterium HGW-Alphaproteobacteria-2]|nr:MAG: hypothetical protein CVT80_08535 [Alphaproteobacteria bacterium HGW-Alphaproteobacteria-2]